MSINLIDLIKGQLGPATVSQTATQLGESESGISKAISALLPAVVGGFVNSNTQSELFSTVKDAASSGILSNLLGNLNGSDSVISKILSLIFGDGDKLAAITNSVSSYAGIKTESTNSLLNLVTGATAGTLGKYAVDNNLDVSSFGNLLSDQKGLLTSLLPAGFSFASLGLGNWFGSVDAEPVNVVPEPLQTPIADVNPVTPVTESSIVTETPKPVVTDTPKVDVTRSGSTHEIVSDNSGGGSIWKWLLPLLLLLLLGWFFWKQCDKKAEVVPVATVDSTTVVTDSTTPAGDSVVTTRETMVVTLPSGKTLQAYKGGIEDQIVTFLKSDDYKNSTEAQLKDKWFNFDNLNFEFGTTKLTPESQIQLDNLKMILAEFPDAKIKIGAYTDNKGDANANLKLSGDRASAVKSALKTAQVVEAEGYGSKFAKVPAEATDKERESDRKTAVRFTK
jgi:outer membrane protein OmpA-like peptidoglycan-associated protein